MKSVKAGHAFFSSDSLPCGLAFMDDLFAGVSETSGLTIADLIHGNGVEVAYGSELSKIMQEKNDW